MKWFVIITLLLQTALAGEIVEENFVTGNYHFSVEVMSNLPYPFVSVETKKVLLITHNSAYWDNNKITWSGTEKLVQHFKTINQPYYYLADIVDRSQSSNPQYFPRGISAKNLYPYQGDSHRIVFQGSDAVIAGGNFTICACQTARSLIGLSQNQDTLNIYYVVDAIYEGHSGGAVTLEKLTAAMSDAELLDYLTKNYFNEDTLPCPESFFKALDRSFKYQIYRNNKFIGNFGQGKTPVSLHFLSSEAVILRLKN